MVFACVGSVVVPILFSLWLIEGKRYKNLLDSMLPKHVIQRLKYSSDSFNFAESYETVTICFCDIVDYTVLCGTLSPVQVVGLLDELYTRFDNLCMKHKVYKVE